jgi:ribosomal protein S18 acetylase RimI-like enzyme
MNGIHFRTATVDDAEFLAEMLVEAVNGSVDGHWSRDEIMQTPELARYIDYWMRPGDLGVIASTPERFPVGAAWLRHWTAVNSGYGYIADDVPELSIAVTPPWRGRGVGRKLTQEILEVARKSKIRAVSLSVSRANFAAGLYTEEGFQVVESFEDSDTMVADLTAQ